MNRLPNPNVDSSADTGITLNNEHGQEVYRHLIINQPPDTRYYAGFQDFEDRILENHNFDLFRFHQFDLINQNNNMRNRVGTRENPIRVDLTNIGRRARGTTNFNILSKQSHTAHAQETYQLQESALIYYKSREATLETQIANLFAECRIYKEEFRVAEEKCKVLSKNNHDLEKQMRKMHRDFLRNQEQCQNRKFLFHELAIRNETSRIVKKNTGDNTKILPHFRPKLPKTPERSVNIKDLIQKEKSRIVAQFTKSDTNADSHKNNKAIEAIRRKAYENRLKEEGWK